jgi:hypothetical protein
MDLSKTFPPKPIIFGMSSPVRMKQLGSAIKILACLLLYLSVNGFLIASTALVIHNCQHIKEQMKFKP